MKKFRLAHIPFVLLGMLLLTAVSASLQQTANAQDEIIGVTPTLYCLAAGCPTLYPTRSTATGAGSTHNATTPITVSPVATTQPCSDASLSPLQTPAQSKRNGREGFLENFFTFFLAIINLLLNMTGTEGLLPCSPSLSVSPPVSAIPSATPLLIAQESANWAGYVINSPVPDNASITTQWTATKIDCSGGDGHASSWPGMGGWGSSDSSIAQIGTAEVCRNSSATYYGWTESFPNPVAPLDSTTHAVKIGDQFSGTVTFKGNGSFMTTLINKTQGWSETMPMKMGSFTPTTSEIITESSSDYPIVPKFDAISYPGSIYSLDGTKQTPLSAVPKLVKITNTSDSGVVRTDTSPINGDTFTTTWTHN